MSLFFLGADIPNQKMLKYPKFAANIILPSSQFHGRHALPGPQAAKAVQRHLVC